MNGFRLSKTWYYIISFTWGLPMNIIGIIAALVMLLTGHKPKKNLYGWYFETKGDWGGVSFGIFSIVSQNPSTHILYHEFGHSIQNCIFGLFFIPFIAIPSVVRYWYRTYLVDIKKMSYLDLPPYDYAWFEGQATMFGERYSSNYHC